MKTISVVTACFNEEDNIEELYRRVRDEIRAAGSYKYEHIFIDNHSTDQTGAILRNLAQRDPNIKVIFNTRNFGHIRSPMYALEQAVGDAIIGIVADMQDPPEMIGEFLRAWEAGYKMVLGVKDSSDESGIVFFLRKCFYRLIQRISAVETFENFTGFGLYDKQVTQLIRSFKDPYPYFRGLIAEIGLPYETIHYHQPKRAKGVTKNGWYSLYDMAMLAVTNLSKVPLRLVAFAGFVSAGLCILAAAFYLIYKLVFWSSFSVGIAPIVIGTFLFCSVQLISLGIIGEYVGALYTHIQARPYVIELERLNFEHEPGLPLAEG